MAARPVKYYSSDWHLGHQNILEYCERPFATLKEMHEVIVGGWLDVVDRADMIYNLGDIALVHDADKFFELVAPYSSREWLSENAYLNTLILGNHDSTKLMNGAYDEMFGSVIGQPGKKKAKKNVLRVTDYLFGVRQKLVLSHYPQDPSTLDTDEINLHGHIHNNLDMDPEQRDMAKYPFLNDGWHFNVSVERLGYKPRTLDEIVILQCRRRNP